MSQGLKISTVSGVRSRIQKKVKIMDDRELENLLDRWRDWSSDGARTGFKTRTIEHQLMIEGAVTRTTGSHVKEDPECERLDAAISAMPLNMHKAIKLKYLFGWTNKDAAKVFKMAIPTYNQLMQRCRAWLCGKLTR